MDLEIIIFKARMAEKAERFEDMITNVKLLAESKPNLDPEEQRLFVAAYKNCVSTRRQALRQITSVQLAEAAETVCRQITLDYKKIIEDELKSLCADVLTILNKHLVPCSTDAKSRVEYLKMKGDFYRYLAEVTGEEERKDYAENAAVAYKEASEIAVSELPPTDPIRLGLALNFSVFFCDILDMPEKAIQIAKAAFQDAVVHLDTLTEDSYREVASTMQLLRDNLSLWTADFPSQQLHQLLDQQMDLTSA